MKDRNGIARKLLALVLCLGLMAQMGMAAFAAENTQEPSEEMEAAAEVSVESVPEEPQDAEYTEDGEAPEDDAVSSAVGVNPEVEEEAVESQATGDEAEPEEADEPVRASFPEDEVEPDVGTAEFWSEFREEYAEDGDYLKWYEFYSQEDSLKRSFEVGDMDEAALEELASSGANPYTYWNYTHAAAHSGDKVVYGIDVSYFQGNIDWSKVKAAGIKFAFIRCGRSLVKTGEIGKDVKMDSYITGAYKAGLKVGIYYFSQALTEKEAQAEAKKTLEYIKPYKSMISMPVAMDIESGSGYRINKVSRAQGTKNVKAYCKIIENAGYDAYYYGNPNDLSNLCDVSQLGAYGCWLARYVGQESKYKSYSTSKRQKTTLPAPVYSGSYDFWQYSSTGKVNGITGSVDCNFWYQKSGNSGEKKPGTVTGLKFTGATAASVSLSWTAADRAGYYIVEQKQSDGSYEAVSEPNGTSCTIAGLSPGTTYTFRVKAANTAGTGSASAAVSVTTTMLGAAAQVSAPVLKSAVCVDGGVRIKWKAVSGAEKYRVFRKIQGGTWKKMGDTTNLTYLNKSVESGTTYTYTVRCVTADGSKYTSGYDKTGVKVTYLSAPEISSVKLSGSGVKVTWGAVTGAVRYGVFRKTGSGGWKKLGSTTKLTYLDEGLANGTKYTYTIRCLTADGGSYASGYNSTGKGITYLKAPALSSVTNSKSGAFAAKWSKNTVASGYQLRYITGSVTKSKTITGASKVSKTVTGLTKGKTYQVSVRAYKTVDGVKVYSLWSSAKSVKISK